MKTPSISIDQRVIEDFISESGKWQAMGSFHLKFENWDIFKRNRPKVVKGFGGWLRIKNLPLDYWCRKTFEVIGNYFGGLEDIATETLNLINCSEAHIQAKQILCSFMPTTYTNYFNRGNDFLSFGDIELMVPPSITKGRLAAKDFTNPIIK